MRNINEFKVKEYSRRIKMHSINICYKVTEIQADSVGKTREDHTNFMKSTHVPGSDTVHPLNTYFTKAVELADPCAQKKVQLEILSSQ